MSDLKRSNKRRQKLLEKVNSRRRMKCKRRRNLNVCVVLKKIEECIDVFEYEEAAKWARKGLKVHPQNTQLLEKAGVVSLEAGLPDEAYKYFCQAVEISPNEGPSKYLYLGQLGSSGEATGHILKGIELLEKEKESVDNATDISAAYCSLAEIYLTDECFSEGADGECYKYCQLAVSSCPSNPEAYQVMANYLLSKDETKEAHSTLLKGVSLWLPDNKDESVSQETNSNDGHTCTGGSDSHEKVSGSDEVESGSVDEIGLDDGSGSQQQVESVLPALPSYDSRINCAKLLLEVGEHKKANQVLTGLTREDDEVASVWYLLGWCHYLTGQYSKAKPHLARVLKLSKKYECDEEEMIEHCQELLEEMEKTEN